MTLVAALCAVVPGARAGDDTPGGPAAPTAPGTDVVVAELSWSPGPALRRAATPVPLRYDPPDGVTPPAPAEPLVDPRYGNVPYTGARALGFALAVDVGTDPIRAWIDRNDDGSLADEEAHEFWRDGLRHVASLSVRLQRDGVAVPVDVRLTRGALESDDTVRADVAVHRSGALVAGSQLIPIALDDGGGDLRFDDPQRDSVLLDLDGDGSLDGAPGSPERFAPGDVVEIGGTLRRLDVATDGSTVRLVAARVPRALPDVFSSRIDSPDGFEQLFTRFAGERDKPANERRATVAAIGALGTPDALAHLDDTARGDRDAEIRVAAVEALGNAVFGRDGEQALLRILGRRDDDIAIAAVRALHRGGFAGRIEGFASMLIARSEPVVFEAARHLAAVDDATARAKLLDALESGRSAALRKALYDGIRASPRAPSSREALAASADRHGPVKLLGLTDLVTQRDSRARKVLVAAAEDPAPSLVAPLLELLAALRDGEATEILLRLGASHGQRAHAVQTLSLMSDALVVPRLCDALADADPDVRRLAAQALAGRRDPRVPTALLRRVGDEPDDTVLGDVVAAVSVCGDTRVLAELAKRAEHHENYALADVLALLGTPWIRDVPEVLPILRRAIEDPSWRVREAAVRAIAEARTPELLPLLRDRLGDERSAVRVAAAEALCELRRRDAVEPLIVALEGERAARAREALSIALFRLTGVYLYDDAALWRKWYADNAATFRIPAETPELPDRLAGPTRDGTGPRFYGIPIETDSVVFVIDRSGSMEGTGIGTSDPTNPGSDGKFATAVRELLRAVQQLDDGALVNVVLFGTDVRTWRDRPQPLSARSRKALQSFLARQTPTGGTNLWDGLERALTMPDIETVVVLSDGSPTHGKYVSDAAILSALRELNAKKQVAISCVAIGANSMLLRRMSEMHGGQYAVR